jgi:hypothetical protein
MYDDVMTLTRNTLYKKNVMSINVKFELKIDLCLFFFQNSTVYDLSNCCVTFAPHCIRGKQDFRNESNFLVSLFTNIFLLLFLYYHTYSPFFFYNQLSVS